MRRLAERGGVGADQHDDVHVRTTRTADTAANATPTSRVANTADGSCIVAAPVATIASTRNHVLRSSDPIDRLRLLDADAEAVARAPVVVHARVRTSTTVNTTNVASAR